MVFLMSQITNLTANSNSYMCVLSHFSCIQLFATPWSIAHQVSLVHGILQARIPEWVTIPFSRGSSQPRDPTQLSCGACIGGRFFTSDQPPGKPLVIAHLLLIVVCVCVCVCVCVWCVKEFQAKEVVCIAMIFITCKQNFELWKNVILMRNFSS